MKRLAAWIQASAVAWGALGIFVISFLDSSFLSFPEVVDLLIIGMVIQRPHLLLYYSLMGTVGSLLGCLVLYYLARAGGEAFVRKRFKERHVDRGLVLAQKYGLLIVIVPALLPPPMPFKIFILIAGVAHRDVEQDLEAEPVHVEADGPLLVRDADGNPAYVRDPRLAVPRRSITHGSSFMSRTPTTQGPAVTRTAASPAS